MRLFLVLLLSACTTTPAPRRAVAGAPSPPPSPTRVDASALIDTRVVIEPPARDAAGCVRRDDGGWSKRCSSCAHSDVDDAGCDQAELQCDYNTNECFATEGCTCDGKRWRCGVQSCP